MVDRIKQLSSNYFKEINEIREHLHANPELSFKEHNTSKYVQRKLTEYGIEFQAGYVETGIIGLIKGKHLNLSLCVEIWMRYQLLKIVLLLIVLKIKV